MRLCTLVLVASFHVICRCARILDSGWLLRFVCHSLEKVSCDLHLKRHFISFRCVCIEQSFVLISVCLYAREKKKRETMHEQKTEPFKKSAKSKWEKLNSFHALPFATCDRCQFSSCFFVHCKANSRYHDVRCQSTVDRQTKSHDLTMKYI